MRVTNQTMVQSSLRSLQQNMQRLADLQEQGSSQRAIGRPSDDPIGTANALHVRAEQQASAQYARNVTDGTGWLTTVDSALGLTTELMNKIRDLTVQGANDGALSAPAKEAIAVELESLGEALLTQANTGYLGRSIFAGSSDAGVAFRDDFTFTGAANSTVERRINANTTVRVDADGAEIFGAGPDSVFALIGTIVADLRGGANVGTHLAALDERMGIIRGQRATIGARHAELQRAEEVILEKNVSLEAQRSAIEDVDMGKLVLDLKVQELAYQSSLAITARTLQQSLMDFLR